MRCTHVCLCSSFPLSLIGPKGEGDQGGEGSPGGLGVSLPPTYQTNPSIPRITVQTFPPNMTLPLDMQTLEPYICSKSRPDTTLRRNQKPREAPETRHRGLNALAHPKTSPLSCRGDRPIAPLARQEGCGTSERRHLLIPLGSVSLPCPPGDGKTPWIEAKQTGHPPPRDRLGGRTVANLRYIKIGVAGRQTPHESSSLGGWPVGELTPHQIKHRGSWGGQDPWLRHVIEIPPGATRPITGPHCALRRLGAGQSPAVCPNSRSTHRA